MFHNLDNFGKEVPAFNIGGETRVSTVCGGVISVAVLTLTLIYSVIKLTQLIDKHNPTINEVTIPDYFTIYEKLNLNEANFRMAFTVENAFGKKKRMDDPRYVKFAV